VRIFVVDATSTGVCALRCHRTAAVPASMSTPVWALTRGAGRAAATGVAVSTGVAASAMTSNAAVSASPRRGGKECTSLGCTIRSMKGNRLQYDEHSGFL
jgi:hypothetical protein